MTEASASTHPAVTAHKPVAILSGENPRFKGEASGNEALRADLDAMQLPYENVLGHYGSPEPSVIVHGISKDAAMQLGKKYGQESIIHGQDGRHKLIYTNGPNEGLAHHGTGTHEAWTKEQGPPEDYWTQLPSGHYFRLHFDWDNLHPHDEGEKQQAVSPLSRKEQKYKLHQNLAKASRNNLLVVEKGNPTVDEKTLSGQDFLNGLKVGLQKLQADIEAMTKAENKQVAKAGLSEGGAGTMSDTPIPMVASEKKVEKALGDGGIADPSTEKMHMSKGELCKMCGEGEKLCKCGELTKFALSKGSLPAGSSPTHPAKDPEKKINTKGKVIEAEGSGGEMVVKAEKEKHDFLARTKSPVSLCKWCGEDFKHPNHNQEPAEEVWETRARRDAAGPKEWRKSEAGGAPSLPGVGAAPKAPKAPKVPKPPAMGAGTPAPNLKAEPSMTKAVGPWAGPFGSGPKKAPVQTMVERVASRMPRSADSMVGETLPASGTPLTGGAAPPAGLKPAKVQTMAERVASKMPVAAPPAPAAPTKPLFAEGAKVPAPTGPAPGLFASPPKKQSI